MPVEIIAHRGASYLAPENTMVSVRLGWDKGADVEVDIRMTKDNRIVVIHDSTTKRIGDMDLEVSETNALELREVDVGRSRSERFAGEKVPFLEEVLATIPPGRTLYVEIKSGQEILPFLETVINDSGKKSQIAIIAFGLETVAAAKKLMPGIEMYWVKGAGRDEETDEYIPHDNSLVQTALDKRLDGLDVNFGGVTEDFAKAVRAAGLKLYIWTVDDPKEAARLRDLKVNGITTNRPGWLRGELAATN